MLIYSNPHYIKDNGSGCSLDVRDAICSKCHSIIDRQEKYRDLFDASWMFSKPSLSEWKYCPYCSEELYEVEVEEDPPAPSTKCDHKWVYQESHYHVNTSGEKKYHYQKLDIYYCEKCMERKDLTRSERSWVTPIWYK